jgi:hypothetical protein
MRHSFDIIAMVPLTLQKMKRGRRYLSIGLLWTASTLAQWIDGFTSPTAEVADLPTDAPCSSGRLEFATIAIEFKGSYRRMTATTRRHFFCSAVNHRASTKTNGQAIGSTFYKRAHASFAVSFEKPLKFR